MIAKIVKDSGVSATSLSERCHLVLRPDFVRLKSFGWSKLNPGVEFFQRLKRGHFGTPGVRTADLIQFLRRRGVHEVITAANLTQISRYRIDVAEHVFRAEAERAG